MIKFILTALMVVGVTFSSVSAEANEFAPKMKSVFESQVKAWLSDPAVISAVKAQNAKHVSISAGDIDKLDKQWRAEAKKGSGPLIDATLANSLSKFLKGKQNASKGVFSEIFVMDNKGLNVGQSAKTSDYMQGDEGKWKKSYGAGAGALFIDEVEFDDSSKTFQSQMSATIVDGGKAIGAITLGVNVEKL